jgi:predicted GNAT superfamily acetyltransferase
VAPCCRPRPWWRSGTPAGRCRARGAASELVGATAAFLGRGSDGRALLHSHVTAVVPGAEGRAVGRALKWYQRAWCLERDILEVRWTYDPLIRRNAVFNLVVLGARVAGFERDVYGPMDDDRNAGAPTDRLWVAWELLAPRVRSAASGRAAAPDVAALRRAGAEVALDEAADGRPVRLAASGPRQLVRIPADIEALRREHPATAADWTDAYRAVLGGSLAEGYRVTGASRDGWYVLTADRDERRRAGGASSRDRAPDPPARSPAARSPAHGASPFGHPPRCRVEAVELVRVTMPLVRPFRTSFGTQTGRDVLLVRVRSPGGTGGASASPRLRRCTRRSSPTARRWSCATTSSPACSRRPGGHGRRRPRAAAWRPRPPHGPRRPRGRRARRPAAGRRHQPRAPPRRRGAAGARRGVGRDPGRRRPRAARAGRGLPGRRLPADQGEGRTRASTSNRSRRCANASVPHSPCRSMRTAATTRTTRRTSPRSTHWTSSTCGCSSSRSPPTGCATTHGTRRGGDPGLPRRVDHRPGGGPGRGRDRRGRDRQHQARPGRGDRPVGRDPRRVRRSRHPGVVRRHAGDRRRSRRERRPGALPGSANPATPPPPTATGARTSRSRSCSRTATSPSPTRPGSGGRRSRNASGTPR